MSFTYDVIEFPHGVLYTAWSQQFFSAKQKRLISLPIKFQVRVHSLNVSKGGCTPPTT